LPKKGRLFNGHQGVQQRKEGRHCTFSDVRNVFVGVRGLVKTPIDIRDVTMFWRHDGNVGTTNLESVEQSG